MKKNILVFLVFLLCVIGGIFIWLNLKKLQPKIKQPTSQQSTIPIMPVIFANLSDSEVLESITLQVKYMFEERGNDAIDEFNTVDSIVDIYNQTLEFVNRDKTNNVFCKWNTKNRKTEPLGLFPLSKIYWDTGTNAEFFLESGQPIQISIEDKNKVITYSWLPDSKKIFFTTEKDFYIVNYDNSELQKIGNLSSKVLPDLAMDGSKIVFVKKKEANM